MANISATGAGTVHGRFGFRMNRLERNEALWFYFLGVTLASWLSRVRLGSDPRFPLLELHPI